MFDFLMAWLVYPWPVWIGTALGFAAAYAVYVFIPETVDRGSLGAWLVALGFMGGVAWAIATKRWGMGEKTDMNTRNEKENKCD